MSIIKAGTVLTITTGCYSDYRDHGPFRVLKDIDQAQARDEFKDQWKPVDEWDTPDPHDFIGWLNQAGYIEDIDGSRSWHAGDYDFEPDIWPEGDAS